jgi:hypothetical protein
MASEGGAICVGRLSGYHRHPHRSARLLPHARQFITEVTAELDLSNLRSFGIKVGVAANLLGEREIATACFDPSSLGAHFQRERANKLENKDLATLCRKELPTLNGPAPSPFR